MALKSKALREKALIEALMAKPVLPVKWVEPTESQIKSQQTIQPTKKKSSDPLAGFDLED